MTSKTCETCGGSGYVPDERTGGWTNTAPCPACVTPPAPAPSGHEAGVEALEEAVGAFLDAWDYQPNASVNQLEAMREALRLYRCAVADAARMLGGDE